MKPLAPERARHAVGRAEGIGGHGGLLVGVVRVPLVHGVHEKA